MRGLRSLRTISTVGATLLLGAFAQPAFATGKPVAAVSASNITPTGATIETTINPEGLETSYEIYVNWEQLSMGHGGRPNGPHSERKLVLATGTLPASTEPQTIIVLAPLEEGISPIFANADVENEAGSTDEGYTPQFATPDAPGTGQPFIESLSTSNITAKSATIEGIYGLEAPSGQVSVFAECEDSSFHLLESKKLAFKKLNHQSGTHSVAAKLKIKKNASTCRVRMLAASTGESVRAKVASFSVP